MVSVSLEWISIVAGLPWGKFYWGDWLKDQAVRALSLEARGFWFDLLCLMQQSARTGYLLIGDHAPSIEHIARLTGCSTDDASRLLSELERTGTFSWSDHRGERVVTCRRMVREARKAEKCAAAGKKGGGNPAIANARLEGKDKGHPKGRPKGRSKGDSEHVPKGASDSDSFKVEVVGFAKQIQPRSKSVEEQAEEIYQAYPLKAGKAHALRAILKALMTESYETLLAATKEYAESPKGKGPYAGYPQGWFNGRHWEDDRRSWQMDGSVSTNRQQRFLEDLRDYARNGDHAAPPPGYEMDEDISQQIHGGE